MTAPRPSTRTGLARGVLLFAVAVFLLFLADGSRQPTSGPGWRILGYQRGVAGSSDILVIPDQDALNVIWDRVRIRTEVPALPSGTTTFWITATGTLGCPAHFAGLQTDRTQPLVQTTFTLAVTSGCDTAAVPDSFLLAIDSDRLPPAPYRLERIGPAGQAAASLVIGP